MTSSDEIIRIDCMDQCEATVDFIGTIAVTRHDLTKFTDEFIELVDKYRI